VAELVDALVLGTSDESRGGSSPFARTSPLFSAPGRLCKQTGKLRRILITPAGISNPADDPCRGGAGPVPRFVDRAVRAHPIDDEESENRMQVEETKNEELTRQFTVTVSAKEIDEKVDARLAEMAQTVKMPGFRPGKVPVSLVKKQYGRSVIGEVLERTISESSAKIMTDNKLRPAMQPKIEITAFDEGKDLVYSMTIELMPEIKQPDFAVLEVERLTVDVTDDMADEALKRIAEEQKNYEKTDEARAATAADAVVVDFTGKVDGKEFPGGAAQDFLLELSSTNFIPGFVEQVVGSKVGDKKTIQVKFPDEYGAAELAGKDAEFDIEVKELRAPAAMVVDDEMAKKMGLESLDAMKAAIKERLGNEYGQIARMRLKRELLDKLAETADFKLPEAMVAGEFAQIWRSISGEVPEGEAGHDHDHEGHDHDHDHKHDDEGPDLIAQQRFKQFLEESGKSVDEIKEEYKGIAERRVRLGLLLAEIGTTNNIKVADDELNRAVVNEARRFPGQEREVIEYYQKNQQALEQLRGPLFEDKVIDYILELAKVTDKPISADELMADPDGDGAGSADDGGEKANKKPAKKKKAATKKS
jgi:trigger factor